MPKTVFVLLDGLRYETARECLGYMEGLVRAGEAQVYEIRSELPSLSRPLYETLMSGQVPAHHGITGNDIVRRSQVENVFSLATAAGLVTAATSYYWYFELYNQAPFSREYHSIRNFAGDIRHGDFYWDAVYPDSHLFADADNLIRNFAPDFLVLHPLNIDDAGHKHGGASREYRDAARNNAELLSRYLPEWRAAGYDLLVTSDHGMSDDGNHGGPHRDEATVPLYTVGARTFTQDPSVKVAQTEIAGLICTMLGIRPGSRMTVPTGLLKG